MENLESVQQAVIIAPKAVQRAKRAATEAGIIDAFERLLLRDGVAGIGVNALVKEAGIGKRQLYSYFGGLSGVATQWIIRRNIWPSLGQLRGQDPMAFAQKSAAEKIRIVNFNYADALRRNPPLCELLTGEFTRSAELKEAIEHVRQLVRRDFEQLFAEDPDLARPEVMELNAMAYAASTYLAMRSNAQPVFFGLDLSTERGWQAAMGMFERVIEGMPLDGSTKAAA
jgi:AcrR family transcriptional regulator